MNQKKVPNWVQLAIDNYVPKEESKKVEVNPKPGDTVRLHYVNCAMPMYVDVMLLSIKEMKIGRDVRYFGKVTYGGLEFQIDTLKPHYEGESWIFSYHEEEIQASHVLPRFDPAGRVK